MEVTLQKFNREGNASYIHCVQELVEEENSFISLDVEGVDEAIIVAWIKTKSSHSLWHHGNQEEAIFYWICVEDEVVGIATIKKQLQVELYADSGHIGMCIQASSRCKGIGTAALKLLLKEAHDTYHMNEILLCTQCNNACSRRLCEKLHGVLNQEDSFCHYWFCEETKVRS